MGHEEWQTVKCVRGIEEIAPPWWLWWYSIDEDRREEIWGLLYID